MKVKSSVRAGKITVNHNQAVKGLRVRSGVKAGDTSGNQDGVKLNHSQSVKGLRVRSSVRAGGVKLNHSQKVAR